MIADEDERPPADMTPVIELMGRFDSHVSPVAYSSGGDFSRLGLVTVGHR